MDLDKLREHSNDSQMKIELSYPKLKIPLYFVVDAILMELANEDDIKKIFDWWGKHYGTDPITCLEILHCECQSTIAIHEKIPGGWDFITWVGDTPMTGTEYNKL